MSADLHSELAELVAAAEGEGVKLVVIGAFAVWAYLARPDRRLTHHLDVVVPASGFEALRGLLARRGYRVYEIGPWWRAEKTVDGERHLVDIAIDVVVDMATFCGWLIDARRARAVAEPGRRPLPVPGIEEVLALKLLSHRDKDVLDAIALVREAGDAIDAKTFRWLIERQDLEIPIRRGMLEVAMCARSGELGRLWAERYAESLDPAELARVTARLEELFE